MLDLIRAAPAIFAVVALAASLLTGGAGFFGRGWIYDTFERPALVEAVKASQLELCRADVEAAAARATQQAQDRYYQIGESLWRQEIQRANDDQAEHEARLRLIHEEAMDYVRGREAEDPGRLVCRPDARDVEHVERVWFGRNPAASPGHPDGGS